MSQLRRVRMGFFACVAVVWSFLDMHGESFSVDYSSSYERSTKKFGDDMPRISNDHKQFFEAMAKDGEIKQHSNIKLTEIESHDPTLGKYLKHAQFALERLQEHNWAIGHKLVGVTDPEDQTPTVRKPTNVLEMIISTSKSSKAKKENMRYYVKLHSSPSLYHHGIALIEAWKVDDTGARRNRIPLKRPLIVWFRRPSILCFLIGGLLIFLGCGIIYSAKNKAKRGKIE